MAVSMALPSELCLSDHLCTIHKRAVHARKRPASTALPTHPVQAPFISSAPRHVTVPIAGGNCSPSSTTGANPGTKKHFPNHLSDMAESQCQGMGRRLPP